MAHQGRRKRTMSDATKDRGLALAREYFKNGFKKTEAIKKVYGWDHEVAVKNCWRLFKNPIVVDELERLKEKAEKSANMDATRVMNLLTMYAESGITLAKFKKKDKDGNLYWDFTDATDEELALVQGLEVSEYYEGRGKDRRLVKKWKITHADPLVALDKLARTLGMYQDNLKVSGTVSLIDRINAARRQASDEEQPSETTVH